MVRPIAISYGIALLVPEQKLTFLDFSLLKFIHIAAVQIVVQKPLQGHRPVESATDPRSDVRRQDTLNKNT